MKISRPIYRWRTVNGLKPPAMPDGDRTKPDASSLASVHTSSARQDSLNGTRARARETR